MNVDIKKIKAAETRNLRQLILRPHQKADELIYEDDEHPDTVHFGAYVQDEICGISSLYKHKLKGIDEIQSWRLRGMATSESCRGKGVGVLLMDECTKHIKNQNGFLFWCNARTTAEGFYEKFGMKRYGDVFTPDGLGEHVVMIKYL
ncbi:MAG: GNAT family N-acetyltransferase [Ignavibacteria bacterium]|nr:GNAT family N-acetyltransferase [Ignavibacteria bacterium]